jgi:phosphatidylglycerol:prolipoprotein diacylglycerol transferase
MNLSFIIWNGTPEILAFGQITLRWYGLLFALGFLLSQQLLTYMYRKEGKPEKEVDHLTILMVVATILGARLGHVIFYQPEMLWQDPLAVLLPFEFKPAFKFTGLQGLASHGGAIAILFGLWMYARKKKQSYLQILDRIVILVALTGSCIRLGNYFNSEIIGKPTNLPWGVVFSGRLSQALEYQGDLTNPVSSTSIQLAADTVAVNPLMPKLVGAVPMNLYLNFKPGVTKEVAYNYVNSRVKGYLATLSDYFSDDPTKPTEFTFEKAGDGYLARVNITGIARHPAQLYESVSCLILFIGLFWYWNKHRIHLPEGRIFGVFLVVLWGLRFSYEFLKENQEAFEDTLPLNMGQILSIPLIIAGVVILIRSFKQKSTAA